jgi:hypothetical protein
MMTVRGPTQDDVDGLEFWRGDRYGECDYCGHADYFSATEPSVSDQRF